MIVHVHQRKKTLFFHLELYYAFLQIFDEASSALGFEDTLLLCR